MRQSKRVFLFILVFALVMCLSSFSVAWATTTSTITIGGTNYALFTGFTATDGNGRNYANLVDGNTATDWSATKNYDDPNAPANDFAGGTADPAFVEFHADKPFIPKGYVLTCDHENAGFWKPVKWALKAKLNEGDEWTTIHSSTTTLGAGKTFNIDCTNTGDNPYQYFRFEVYEVGTTGKVDLDELQFYGKLCLVSARAATCTEYGLSAACYEGLDGKYYADAYATTELTVGNGLIAKLPHTAVHHEASSTNIEYWQCSVCHKYFSDSDCTTEITEAETQSTVFGSLTDGCYTLTSQTYTLTDDVNTAGYIYVPAGVTATIDLAGHTIDRGLTSAVEDGYVIKVAGTLTLTDSGTGGTVRGGMGSSTNKTSCVYVPDDGTFTLAGGTLIGNTSNEGNQAVYVAYSAHFIMTGGKITGDVCGIDASGYLTISGGEISGNSQRGIYSGSYSISVSGNPRITGNGDVNVNLYYKDAARLTVTGALTEGASIGITPHGTPTANAPVTVTSGYGTYNTAAPDTYFTVDDNSLALGWNEDRTEVAVGTALYTVGFDMNGHGTAIDAVSLLSGYKVAGPTEPTADGWYFVGWYTDSECTAGNEWNFDDAVTSDMTLYAKWTQTAIHSITLPEKMVIVSTSNAPVGRKYLAGTVIKFKAVQDYMVEGDVSDGTNTLTADGEGIYTITMGEADITITATVKKAVEPNKTLSGNENYTANDGDVLTGSTSGTLTITDGAKITLSDVTISGGIVCNGTAEITLVGTNSVTGKSQKAGIQVGGSGTTLTIKGNGSLSATGNQYSAGIGLSRAWDVDATGGDIVIEGGTITATGNGYGAGIGTGVNWGGSSNKTATLGNITIKGGTVTAIGGTGDGNGLNGGNGIGKGYAYSYGHAVVGTITIYDDIDMVDATSISESVTYKHGETDVTSNASTYFSITEDGDRRIIEPKPYDVTISESITNGAITANPAQAVIGETVTLTVKTGYEAKNVTVKNGSTSITVTANADGTYSFTMPAGGVTVEADVTPITYTITYDLDGGTVATANPITYTVETEIFTLTNPTKDGYTFAGWTGTGLNGATITVEIAKGSTGNRSYTATWTPKGGKSEEDDPTKPTFKSHSVVLDGEIGMNFYMNLPTLTGVDYDDHDKCYMEFDVSGDKSNALQYKDTGFSYTENGKTYYGFRCYVMSVQMADTIRAVFHYGNDQMVSQDYSVKEYLDAVLDGNFTGDAKDLMLAIQDYGHYAQLMLSQENDWTIGERFAEMPGATTYNASDIAEAKDGVKNNAVVRDTGTSSIQEVQFTLLFASKTTINVYLEVKDEYTGEITAILDGGTDNVATKLKDKEYLVQIVNIPAHLLAETHTITVNAGSSFPVRVSGLSYVKAVLDSEAGSIGKVDITTMKNAVTALYRYYAATMQYKASSGQ